MNKVKTISFHKTSFCLMIFLCYSCVVERSLDTITFATSAEYPPFEFQERDELKGFDIDLGRLIANELGKVAIFENMQFSNILPAISVVRVDAAISTITITEERRKNFDLSESYYVESLAAVFKTNTPIKTPNNLEGKKVGCQLGTTMEIWLKSHIQTASIIAFDNNNQSIEALKAGHVDTVLMDGIQGLMFSKSNPGLESRVIAKADHGYGIALQKGSPITTKINRALKKLSENGEIKKLEAKWLGAGYAELY